MQRLLVFAVLCALFLTVDARAGVPGQETADDDTAQNKGAKPTGSKFTSAERRTMMQLHNAERSSVGVPPLKWSPELATYAQKWADHLASTGTTPQHRPATGEWKELYGEGVYGGFGPNAGVNDAFTNWMASKKFYKGQPVSASDLRAANYTQLVWSTSTQIGCGKAISKDRNSTVIIICNYDPKGNMVGQKPY
jgi:pathogenesis-related protein 1